ncbi:Transposase, Mutator family [Desulforamulus aeronauticus DSM 10349]|uniref:Transposase, Mutator family n=1 Tax=Desulforamulus aeronauticus DSM 10349 TaxID=1121421 RepID=A0A1M6QEU1_9FIRM|nr:Transposase, Mutator family [Desulforamulus aeronauticus DSM 10349]
MDEHLGYEKHDVTGKNSGNNRNGYSKKRIKTRFSKTELSIPRDRNGEFSTVYYGYFSIGFYSSASPG